MRTKTTLAAAIILGSSMSASAGGLLDANVSQPPAAPMVVAPTTGNQGSLGGTLPYILGGLLIAAAVSSGSGT